jgi:hypothetical protein
MLLALLFAAAPAPAPKWACPDTIKTAQSMRDVPAGWTPFIDTVNTRHRLERVDFYDGNPKELADLAPDNADSGQPPVWTFTRTPGHSIYQVCSYTQTAVRMVRPIPDDIKSCSARPSDNTIIVSCK